MKFHDTGSRAREAALFVLKLAAAFAVLAAVAGSARAAGALGDIPLTNTVYTAAEADAAFAPRSWYATSATAQATTAKVATTATGDFALTNGATVLVKFTNANTAATPTLNVDGTGAKTVRKFGTTSALAYEWQPGEVVPFVYDGTQFQIVKGGWATTTYYGATKLSSSTNSTSTALAATPYAVKLVREEVGRVAASSVSASSLASATNTLSASVPSLLGSPYVHLGSTVVEDSAWLATFVGGGSYAGGVLTVMPEAQTKDTGVFKATITSSNWIVDLEGQAETTDYIATQEPSAAPTSYRISRIDGHTFEVAATNVTPSYTANKPYFMRIRDFKVLTYDRPLYTPNATTNDAAALPSFVDTVRIADLTNTPARIVANAQSVRNYIDARKPEIAKAAWSYTPAGNKAQTGAVTLDLPVVHRGAFSWISAGNAVAISADGGDWVADAEGSYYQIGLGGRADFRLTATDQQLQITDMQWANAGTTNATISLDVPVSQLADPSTPPTIRYIDSLEPPFDWVDCTEQVSSRVSSVWRCTVSGALADVRFFSAWAAQGADTAYLRAPLELGSGRIVIGNDTFSVQTVTIGGTAYKILASPQ